MKLLKLMQTFVMKKFLFLMVASVFKWSLLFLLQINPASINSYYVTLPATYTDVIFHPFFVSVTEFNHNPKAKTVEISCKMFADDFESTLKNQYKITIDISHPKDAKLAEKYVFEYLQKHLRVKINGKPSIFQFVGYEKEEEAVWGYLQINNVPLVKKIEVMNNILYEANTTQISIMHATVGGTHKSTRLVYPDTTAVFEWGE